MIHGSQGVDSCHQPSRWDQRRSTSKVDELLTRPRLSRRRREQHWATRYCNLNSFLVSAACISVQIRMNWIPTIESMNNAESQFARCITATVNAKKGDAWSSVKQSTMTEWPLLKENHLTTRSPLCLWVIEVMALVHVSKDTKGLVVRGSRNYMVATLLP